MSEDVIVKPAFQASPSGDLIADRWLGFAVQKQEPKHLDPNVTASIATRRANAARERLERLAKMPETFKQSDVASIIFAHVENNTNRNSYSKRLCKTWIDDGLVIQTAEGFTKLKDHVEQ